MQGYPKHRGNGGRNSAGSRTDGGPRGAEASGNGRRADSTLLAEEKSAGLAALPKPQKAHHPEGKKRVLTARLKRIEGQVRGIAGMIERDVYCDDILHQITAVEAALGGVRRLLLEAHIRSCVVEQVRQGRDEVIDELMITIGKMGR
jgi:DNA-binding FrmR family transcriptional regulator